MLELTEQLCDEDAGDASLYRPVSDRLMNIFQQLNNTRTSVPLFLIEEFGAILDRFNRYLLSEVDSDAYSIASSLSVDSLDAIGSNGVYRFHHDLDRLMNEAPDLLNTPRLHQWRHLLRQEETGQQQEEIAAAWENMSAQEFEGDVVETHKATDEGSDYDTTDDKHSSPRWLLPTNEVQIIKCIAHGSFGAAYWGKWLDTDVVVKKVLTNQHETRNRQQFRHEVELWFSLNHANVIKLYGACQEQDKQPVFVCERALNGTLPSFLKGKAREEIWGALYTAAQGLHHLHERGIVHGDLKGNNILVCDNDFVKLADFGLSEIAKPVLTPVDKPGSIGAIRWRAPECINGFKPNFASDIYSFGMCIVEAVTGDFPWGRMPDPSVINHVVNEKSLPSRWDQFNRDEERLVKRMCQYDPNDRIEIGAVVCLL
ncbi:hypothetical protein PHYSODRAFT_471956, partial [Phytophthora sojae]